MKLLGKRPPDPNILRVAADEGFDEIELYLSQESIKDTETIYKTIVESSVDVPVIHTPHVTINSLNLIKETERLASALDAYLIVHSQYLQAVHIPKIIELELSNFAFENNPGSSIRHIEAMIIDQGYDLVLDTAHLYMAHANYIDRIEELLDEHNDSISVIHLTNSTLTQDGVPFSEGEMDMVRLARVLDERFEGKAVLEVMPEYQLSARRQIEAAINDSSV